MSKHDSNSKRHLLVGIAWFRKDQYELLRALSVDADSMANTYEEWLAHVTKTMKDMRGLGIIGRKVDVDVKELAAWCEQQGKPLDGRARSTYAAEHFRSDHLGT